MLLSIYLQLNGHFILHYETKIEVPCCTVLQDSLVMHLATRSCILCSIILLSSNITINTSAIHTSINMTLTTTIYNWTIMNYLCLNVFYLIDFISMIFLNYYNHYTAAVVCTYSSTLFFSRAATRQNIFL